MSVERASSTHRHREDPNTKLTEIGERYLEHIIECAREPHIAFEDAEAITGGEADFGVVLGGTGTGEAIEANRLFGVRAAVYYGGPEEIIKLAREHNDANILSLGARFISEDEAKRAVDLFLDTKFSGDERHKRRILKLDN
jgi:ribose 5-phosphate isomerase B